MVPLQRRSVHSTVRLCKFFEVRAHELLVLAIISVFLLAFDIETVSIEICISATGERGDEVRWCQCKAAAPMQYLPRLSPLTL